MRLFLIGVFWVGGAVLGWDTAAATHSTRSHAAAAVIPQDAQISEVALPHSSTLVVVQVPAKPFTPEEQQKKELEKLATRN
jgi:hypothetical protein